MMQGRSDQGDSKASTADGEARRSSGEAEPELVCQPGQRVGDGCLIEKLVARGGMAEIYRAHHDIMGRDVAIKVLSRRYRHRADVVRRFESEARALAEIRHPNVVAIYHAGRDPEVGSYAIMELLEGMNCRALMHRKGALPIDQSLAIAIEIADATHALHELGIFHRDIKPENIFLARAPGQSRVLKLLDLGAAKVAKYGHRTTEEHHTIGTGAYMSPEHCNGGKITQASDQYSLGLMLYEMIRGLHAFGSDHPTTPTHMDFCGWQLFATPKPLTQALGDFPAYVWDVIARSIEKDAEKRYPSVAAFAKAMREASTRYAAALRLAAEAEEEGDDLEDDDGGEEQALEGERTDRASRISGIDEALRAQPESARRPGPRGTLPLVSAPLVSAPLVSAPLVTPRRLGPQGTAVIDEPARAEPASPEATVAFPKLLLTIVEGPRDVGKTGRLQGPAGTFFSLGRGGDAGFALIAPDVSRHHARITISEQGPWAIALQGAANGLSVNDVAVQAGAIGPGDRVRIGDFVIAVSRETAEHAASLAGEVRSRATVPATSAPTPVESAAVAGAIALLPASVVLLSGALRGKTARLNAERMVIGRDPRAELPIEDGTVSHRHAELRFADGRWHIADLGSANGTFVNDEPITGTRMLAMFDKIACGRVAMSYSDERPESVALSNKALAAKEAESAAAEAATAAARKAVVLKAKRAAARRERFDRLLMVALCLVIGAVLGLIVWRLGWIR